MRSRLTTSSIFAVVVGCSSLALACISVTILAGGAFAPVSVALLSDALITTIAAAQSSCSTALRSKREFHSPQPARGQHPFHSHLATVENAIDLGFDDPANLGFRKPELIGNSGKGITARQRVEHGFGVGHRAVLTLAPRRVAHVGSTPSQAA